VYASRVVIIVMDSVGIGELPDAKDFGDEGSNTLANTASVVGGLHLPNLAALGLGNIHPILGVPAQTDPMGSFGKMAERAAGKDTLTGHWELAGLVLERPFPTYPDGFPPDVIEAFEKAVGRRTLGNKAASGTVIIEELGQEHIETGWPIVYTSADSVFQIAAHEDVIDIEELYSMCQTARHILQGQHGVGRVIARPFIGSPGSFKRTERRRDYTLKPPSNTMLDIVKEADLSVQAVGKIEDIFVHQGITHSIHATNNQGCIDATLAFLKETHKGIIFTNCVDFDMLYGHRNDPEGYAQALEDFDLRVPEILEALREDDVLIITADHGCDPTTPSTDHSREYVPLLVYGKMLNRGVDLGVRSTFADVSATTLDFLGLKQEGKGLAGISFRKEILPL
jgi:phosphopentomutase